MKNFNDSKQLAQEQANIHKEVFVVVRICNEGEHFGEYDVVSQKQLVGMMEDCGRYWELEETVFAQEDPFAHDAMLNVVEITTALRAITSIDERVIVVDNKQAADTLSYIIHRADQRTGTMEQLTINSVEKNYWAVSK